jgi:hypothetical protein
LLELAKEAASYNILEATTKPIFRCTIFEDNKSTVKMANVPKMHPHTKHLNIKYHFFHQYVEDGTISVLHIPEEQHMMGRPAVGPADSSGLVSSPSTSAISK